MKALDSYLFLRAGARFGFILDEELKEAASCDEVKAALSAKISRERIGTEVNSFFYASSGDCSEYCLIYDDTFVAV